MSLITFRTQGMTRAQQEDLHETFECLAKIINHQDQRIDALETELARLKAEPRMSLAQKLRSKR